MRDSYEIKENGRTDPAVIKHGIKLKQKLRKFGFLNNLLFLTKVKKKKKEKDPEIQRTGQQKLGESEQKESCADMQIPYLNPGSAFPATEGN